MSQELSLTSLRERTVVLRPAAVDTVRPPRELIYHTTETESLTFDLYTPPTGHGPFPAVIIASGFPDPGYEKILGSKFKDMGWSRSWARLLALAGLAAVVPTNRHPLLDTLELVAVIGAQGGSWGLDAERLGVLASSGSGPLALELMAAGSFRAAALLYPFLLSPPETTMVEDAARTWGFTPPAAGRSISDLPGPTALLVVRAGHDETPGLLTALDYFVSEALSHDHALTMIQHAGAPHAFDLFDDSEATRLVVTHVLDFMKLELSASKTR